VGIFDNATLVDEDDNTSDTKPSIFSNAKLVEEEKPSMFAPITKFAAGDGFNPLDESLGGDTTYDPKTNKYSVVGGAGGIQPFISAKDDPIIEGMLKDEKLKKFLEENWTGSVLKTKTGNLTGDVPFEGELSLDEKFKLFDQNNGRTLLFKDGTRQDINFSAIADKYIYKRGAENVQPSGIYFGMGAEGAFDKKRKEGVDPLNIEYVDKNLQKFVTHLKETVKLDDKAIAALVKNESERNRFVEGAIASSNFLVEAGLFALGQVVPRVEKVVNNVFTINLEGAKIATSEDRGDLLNKYTPSLARALQRRMKLGGIDLTIEQAEAVMNYSPSLVERGKKFAGEVVPIGGPVSILQWTNRTRIGLEFAEFTAKRNYKSFGESADAFVNYKMKNSGIISNFLNRAMPNLRKNMYDDALAGSFEIKDLKLPPTERIAYKNQVKVVDSIQRRIISSKPKNMLDSDWINTPKYKELTRQKRIALIELQATKLKGYLPKFMRENLAAEGTVILFGASAGQIFQAFGQNENTGEILGILAGVTRASGLIPKDYQGLTSAGLENAVNFTGKKLLGALEILHFGRGYFLRDSSVYKTLTPKQIQQVETLASGFNDLAPEIRDEVLQRVQVFFESRDELIKAGVSEEILNTTLSKLTGLAVLELAEASLTSMVSSGEALSSKVLNDFQKITSQKDNLNEALATVAAELTPKIKSEGGDVVSEFITKLNDGVENLKIQNDELKNSLAAVASTMEDEYINQIALSSSKFEDGEELSTLLNTIYDLSDININTVGVRNSIDNIRQTEKKIHTEVYQQIVKLRNTAKTPEDFKNIDHYLEIISENKRKSLKKQVKLNYQKIDEDFANLNARADATSLFTKIMDYSLDKSLPAFKVGNQAISDSVANNLLKQFDNASKESLDKFAAKSGDPDEFYDTIKDQMIDAGYNRKDIRPSTMVYFLRSSENINIPVNLKYQEVEAIASGLKKQYWAASSKNLPSTGNYDTFAKDAESLFEKFTLPDGTPIGEELSKRQKEANEAYFSQYAARILRKNTIGVDWLTYSGKTNVNDLTPSGKVWNNSVRTWIDIDKVAKNKGLAQDLNGKLRTHFGKEQKTTIDGKTSSTYILTDEIDEGGAVGEVGRYKTIQYIANRLKQRKPDGTYVTINDMYDELDNIQAAFSGTGFDPYDIIGDGGYFSIDAASRRNKDLENILPNIKREGTKAINDALGPANFYQKKIEKNIRWFEKNVEGLQDAGSMFNFIINAPPKRLQQLKEIALLKGNMKADEFDEMLKYTVSSFINDQVFQQTMRKSLFGDKTKVAASLINTDMNALNTLLSGNTQRATNLRKVLGDEHYDRLQAVSKFLSLREGKIAENTTMTGIPRGLSVESWISRVYAVNRNVISKRYVATEAAIQAARLNNFSILEEMIKNPEAAQLFGDIILSGKPLTDQQNARITQIIYTGIARLNQRTPESPFFGKVGKVVSGTAGFITDKAINIGSQIKEEIGFFN